MEERLVALAVFLREFNIDISVESLGQRKTLQKAVYLGQLSGVSLGYSYGWYLMGPYSPGLTQDYFQLSGIADAGEGDWETREFSPSVRERLNNIKPLMTPPSGWTLEKSDWLELVASLHFLIDKSRLQYEKAVETLATEKAKLAPYADQALNALKQVGLTR